MCPASSPYRSIWHLTWPQLFMMFFQFAIGALDVYVCGIIGRDAQAAMGLISQASSIFLVVALAVANGSVAALTQSLGAGKRLRALRYGGLCLSMGVVFSALILACGLIFRDAFLSILNVPAEILASSRSILGVFLCILPVNYLTILTNTVLRAHKMVMVPLAAMAVTFLLNTWLDFGLGLGRWGMPDMGYMGVAWATFWSSCGGLLLNVILLARAKLLVRAMFAPWRWMRAAAPYVFKVAWPAGFVQVIWQMGYLTLLVVLNGLPSGAVDALAGFAGGGRVESAIFLPAVAFNSSASIMVGHALGTGDKAEAKRMGYRVWRLGVAVMTAVSIPLWFFLPEVAGIFTNDPNVAAQTISYLRYNLSAVPFTCTSMIIGGALTGAGATMYTFLVFILSVGLVRLPVAWWLGWKAWGTADGVWFSMLVSQMVQASALLFMFQFKNWAKYSMMKQRNPHA